MSWEKVSIGDCVLKVLNCSPKEKFGENEFTYIDIASVDNVQKGITQQQTILGVDAPSRARQIVRESDVLVSTIRPNLNAVAHIDYNNENMIASTGYCVLRVNPNKLDSKYLYYWVRSSVFINDMVKKATGASYPAVSDSTIKDSKIPLPPLHVQQHIANVLDKADALRQKDQQLLQKYDELAQSIFYNMFGDPVKNERVWEVKKLKDITTKIQSGNTPKGGSNVYVKEGITFFRSQNVWKNKLDYDDIAFIDDSTHASMRNSSLKNRDILMTKTGRINTENSSLGRAALFLGKDDSANINGHVYVIRPQKNQINEFIVYILTTKEYRNLIREVCVGGIDKRQLNKEHIEQFPIIFPLLSDQRIFTEVLNNITLQKNSILKDKSNDLFDTLMNRYFEN